jgi:phosphoribosyl 1,2-cyclic phosphodiesterase/ActR/RegA family two-component response regulator
MKTALIIDDDAQFRAAVGTYLRTNGWRVIEADCGETGLEAAHHHRPHIVLCDLLMPRGNGFQVCRTIRAEVALRQTRIIITSGRDYEADRAAAREAGADEYLAKPMAMETILGTMERLLNSVPAPGKPRPPAAVHPVVSPVTVKFWGVRGSIPSPGPDTVRHGGNTSCVEVRAGNEIIILDAGTGLRQLGRALMAEFKDRQLDLNLLLTHTHWDHIQGLPFFGPIYQSNCHLRILGYEGARRSLMNILSGQMESQYFPVPFHELPGNVEIEELKELRFQVGAVRVEAWFVNHPGICVGFRLFTADGSVVYIPDNEPLSRHRIETAIWPRAGRETVEYALGEEARMIEFLRGADVLILDAQYDREEYREHVGWGHGCVDDAVDIALRAGVKRLCLFHHDPDHSDTKLDAMTAHARQRVSAAGAALVVEAAVENATIQLAEVSGRRA